MRRRQTAKLRRSEAHVSMKLNFRQTDGSSSATPVLPPPTAIPPRRLFHSNSAAPPIPPPLPRPLREDSQNEIEEDTSVAPQSPSPVIHVGEHPVPISPSFSTTDAALPILNEQQSPTFFNQLPPQSQPHQDYSQALRGEQARRSSRHTSQPRRVRNASREPKLTIQKGLLYTLGILIVLATPFFLPIIISRTARLARASSHMLPVEIRLTERAKHTLFQAWSEALDALSLSSSSQKTWSPSIVWAGSTTATNDGKDVEAQDNLTKLDSRSSNISSEDGHKPEPSIGKKDSGSSNEESKKTVKQEMAIQNLQNGYTGSNTDNTYGGMAWTMQPNGFSYGPAMSNLGTMHHSWNREGIQGPQFDPNLQMRHVQHGMTVPSNHYYSNGAHMGALTTQQQMNGMAAVAIPQEMYRPYEASSMPPNMVTATLAPVVIAPHAEDTKTPVQPNPIERSFSKNSGGNPERDLVTGGQVEGTMKDMNAAHLNSDRIEGILARSPSSDVPYQTSDFQHNLVESKDAVRNIKDAPAVKERNFKTSYYSESGRTPSKNHNIMGSKDYDGNDDLGNFQSEERSKEDKSEFTKRYHQEEHKEERMEGLRNRNEQDEHSGIPDFSDNTKKSVSLDKDSGGRRAEITVEFEKKFVIPPKVGNHISVEHIGERHGSIREQSRNAGKFYGSSGYKSTDFRSLTKHDLDYIPRSTENKINSKTGKQIDMTRENVSVGQESEPERYVEATTRQPDGSAKGLQMDDFVSFDPQKKSETKDRSDGNKHGDSIAAIASNVASEAVRNEVLDGNARNWEKYTVVSDGKVHLAKAVEQRLKKEVLPRANNLLLEQLVGRSEKCSKMKVESVSFDTERGVAAQVAVVTGCGHGLTCISHAEVGDFYRLVLVVDGSESGYLLVEQTSGHEGKKWGPLQGPLHVTLSDDGAMILRGSCERIGGGFLSWTRNTSIGDIKRTLREISQVKGRSFNWDDVFIYDAHPRRYVRHKS